MNSWFGFVLLGLTVWRITHLFSYEDGPFDLIIKFRNLFGQGILGTLLDCFYCLSIWIALPFAFVNSHTVGDVLLYWGALSGFACALEKVTYKLTD